MRERLNFLIDSIVERASGARAAMALAALGFGGMLLFRLSPYDATKELLGGAALPEEGITSADELAATLEALGAAGRESYLEFQVWDLANPVLIGLAGAMVLGWLIKRGQRTESIWRYAVLLPIALGVADLVENLVISLAVVAFPERGALTGVLPVVTAAKFGAAFAMIASVVIQMAMALRDRLARARPR